MSLIPFILDLADELQEYQRCLIGAGGVGVGVGSGYSAMDIDEVNFGLQPSHEAASTQNTTPQQQQQQQQQPQAEQQQRRQRLLSQLYWPSNIMQKHQQQQHQHHHHHHHRHHPYAQTACLCSSVKDRDSAAVRIKANSTAGQINKPTAYPVINKNGWMIVSMNVKQFTPDELIVKTIDNCIIVEGRHEDKEDIYGVISRHFIRKYMLPKGYDPNDVVSTLSSDGILTVKAPPPTPPKTNDEATERFVDIKQATATTAAPAAGPTQTAVNQATPPSPTPSPSPQLTAAAETSLEEKNSHLPKASSSSSAEQTDLNIGEIGTSSTLEQTIQFDVEEAMQTEHSSNEGEPIIEEELVDVQIGKGELNEKLSKSDVVVVVDACSVADANSENTSSVDVDVKIATDADADAAVDVAAIGKPVQAVQDVAAESLAESAKPEMKVDVVTPAEMTDESLVHSNAATAAAAIDVPMSANVLNNADDDGVGDEVKALTACNVNANTNANTNTDINSPAQLCSNDANEKNGIVADVSSVVSKTPVPLIKTAAAAAAAVLPAEVSASLDLGVCVSKSVVIDAAASAAVKEAAEAGTADEKNGVGVGVDVGDAGGAIDDNRVVVGVAAIDAFPAATEEIVAN